MTKPQGALAASAWSGPEKIDRREAMRRTVGVALGVASLSCQALAQSSTRDDFSSIRLSAAAKYPPIPQWNTELKLLAPNVYAYNQSLEVARPVLIANAGLIAGPDHLMAIDSMAWPSHTKAFMAAAKQATGKDFGRLVNTHHHGDHVLGNQYFLPAEIVGHEYCREQVLKMADGKTWPKTEGQAEGTEVSYKTPPTVTISDRLTYYYGDLQVELMHVGPAHTWGDVMVYLPQHKILFAGDIAFHYVTPVAQSGHISKWIETVDKILDMDVETIVPGHGLVGGKKEIADMREYFVIQRREGKKRYDAGVSPGRAAAEIDMGKYELWARPERAATNMVRLYAEFAGNILPEEDPGTLRPATAEYAALRNVTVPAMPI
jgi:cyclase